MFSLITVIGRLRRASASLSLSTAPTRRRGRCATTGSNPTTHLPREASAPVPPVGASASGCMAIFAKDAYAAATSGHDAAGAALRARRGARSGPSSPSPRGPSASPRAPRRCSPASASGAVGYAAQAGLFFGALTRIDASLTSLLLYIYPALVFVGAVALRREHADRRARRRARARQRRHRARAARRRRVGAARAASASPWPRRRGRLRRPTSWSPTGIVGRLDPFLLERARHHRRRRDVLDRRRWSTAALDLRLSARGLAGLAALVAGLRPSLPITAFLVGLRRVGPATATSSRPLEPRRDGRRWR